jgi:hypothetical protein
VADFVAWFDRLPRGIRSPPTMGLMILRPVTIAKLGRS